MIIHAFLHYLHETAIFKYILKFCLYFSAIEEESVRSHFTDCGEIDNVRIIRDRKTNLGKGFCYVLFKVSSPTLFLL